MTQTSETSFQPADTEEVRQQLKGKHVCPFCGVIRGDQAQPCPRCTMEDTLSTRQGTRQRIGPWYVMQARNPSAPGMKFATLISLVKKGHVTPRSIVRGPTTHQLWTFAAKVRGLSRELGLCHHCGESVDLTTTTCSACGRLQEPPADPDVLMENQSGLPELNLTATTNPETSLDSGATTETSTTDLSGLTLSKSGRPPMPTISTTPAAGRPAQPTRTEESILSARELAAAFQLDFKPKKPVATINRSISQQAPVAPVLSKPVEEVESEPVHPSWGKRIALTMLLILVAGAVAVAIKPEWREQAVQAFANFKSSLEKPAVSPSPNNTRSAPAPKDDPKPVKPAVPTVNIDPAPTKIEVVETKPKEPEIKKEEPKPEPPPAVVTKVVEKKVPVVDTGYNDSNLTIEQAITLGKSLRNQAIDLETEGNWHQALNLYQRIEKLPNEAWPLDLKTKIDRARSKVK